MCGIPEITQDIQETRLSRLPKSMSSGFNIESGEQLKTQDTNLWPPCAHVYTHSYINMHTCKHAYIPHIYTNTNLKTGARNSDAYI